MNEKQKGTLTVLVTQCIVCAVVLLLGLVIRAVGGGFAAEAKAGLFAALADNTFADTLFDSPKKSTTTTTTTTTATTTRAAGEKELVAANAYIKTENEEQRATELPPPVCLPLSGGVLTSAFGEREHPVNGGVSMHTGWDVAADEGTPLAAMYTATVCKIGSGGSYGNYVEMQVTDWFSVIYAHCSALCVKEGEHVKAGQTVGYVGSTGVSTGNHLHLELLVDAVPVDPSLALPLSLYAG